MPSEKALKPLPYYQWYWQDFRANRTVQRMTYVERGLYRDLLDECWVEGGIPDDIESLADICGCPVDVMAGAWQVLGRCFVRVNGRLTNAKLDSVRTEKDRQRLNKADAGRLGGSAKALKDNDSVADASKCLANPSECHIEEKSREEDRREDSPSDLSSGKPSDPIPAQAVADLYNRACGDIFPAVTKLTDKRRKQIRARWKANTDDPDERKRTNSLDYWQRYFAFCATVPFFLRAARGENKGDHAGWVPGFDYLMREQTWLDIREGKHK